MEKAISLGVITALNIEREGFLEALKLHNDVLNQTTEIKEFIDPSIGNTVYESKLFYQNPNNKNALEKMDVQVMTNKSMGVVSATRCTMDLLNFMESKSNSEKLLAMSGICAGSSTHTYKPHQSDQKRKLQMCDVIVADPVFLINETKQTYLDSEEDDPQHQFWFTEKRGPQDENYLKKHPNDRFGILGINSDLKSFIKSSFLAPESSMHWKSRLDLIDNEKGFTSRLEKASAVQAQKRNKVYPSVRQIDAILTAMGTTDRVRSDGGNVFREAHMTVPDTMAIDMESYAVYRTIWMWDHYQRQLKQRKFEAKNGAVVPDVPRTAEESKIANKKIKDLHEKLHTTTNRICVKGIVDFADESIDEEFYDVAAKAAGSWVCDLAKEFSVFRQLKKTKQ